MSVLIPRFDESTTVHAQWSSILERFQFQEQQKILKRENEAAALISLPFQKKEIDSVKEFGGNVSYTSYIYMNIICTMAVDGKGTVVDIGRI